MKHALFCLSSASLNDDANVSDPAPRCLEILQQGGWKVTLFVWGSSLSQRTQSNLERSGVRVFSKHSITLVELVTATTFELCVLENWAGGEYCLPILRKVSPKTKIFVNSLEILPLRLRKERSGLLGSETSRQLSMELFAELNVYGASDGILVHSQSARRLARGLVGDDLPAFQMPTVSKFSRSVIPFEFRQGIIVSVDLRRKGDRDALDFLCNEIIPRLSENTRAEHPISVIGAGSQVGRGRVPFQSIDAGPDLESCLSHAAAFLVPSRNDGRSPNLVHAMMVGTPVVSTSVASRWLGPAAEGSLIQADDTSAIVDSLERLLSDQQFWEGLGEAAGCFAKEFHSIELARTFGDSLANSTRSARPVPLPFMDANAFEHRRRHLDALQLTLELQTELVGVAEKGTRVTFFGGEDQDLPEFDDYSVESFCLGLNNEPQRPRTSAEAIELVQRAHDRGVSCLVVCGHALKSLSELHGLSEYLDSHCVEIASSSLFRIFSLSGDAELVAARLSPGVSSSGAASADTPLPEVPTSLDTRLLAFVLPQYHPIAENDAWWQPGFTEWTNVARAQPFFEGHDQPRYPSDLGYYDLRSAETRELQAEMARAYGVHGFCHYHYWFQGKRLLGRPFDELLASSVDFPFALCWANEPWTRRWDGGNDEVLQPQHYSRADDLAHIQWLLPALADDRAIKINGKPLFLVYRPRSMPDPEATVDLWRSEVQRVGLGGIYLMAVETGWDVGRDATSFGFDSSVLFAPEFNLLDTVRQIRHDGPNSLRVYPYEEAWQVLSRPTPVSYRRYPSVFPQWDNTARMGENGVVVHGSTPELYEKWLLRSIDEVSKYPADERLVFVNAWNEWGEGAHLEPDLTHGRGYLDATRRALLASSRLSREVL
jgi:Glycosyltransferase WbsX/Glycosyl transferases group 1